jgi:protein LSM14
MAVPTEDFNFEAAFQKFSKEALAQRAHSQPVATYVKDDFFDSMSCEALERLAMTQNSQGRSRFHEQRKLDMDTFGAAGAARRDTRGDQGAGRGGGRDGGRGGRDGGRGRGDGGGRGRGDGGRGGRGGRDGGRGDTRGFVQVGRGGRAGRGRN